jgi:uncharacterized protein
VTSPPVREPADVVAGLTAFLGRSVELRETHTSWVLLTAQRAYKLKKPVHFGFLDLREPAARKRACEQEVEANHALAAEIVLGVRAVIRRDGALAMAEADAPDAVDWVVEMRRFDEEATMASAIGRDALDRGDVIATARTIESFHAGTARMPATRWSQHVAAAWHENLDELTEAGGGTPAAGRADAWRRFAAGFLRCRAAEMDERASSGRVVDGHGDLRAEHVVLGAGSVTIVDRLEFDPHLRHVDVADDVAFLVMDLHALGAGWAADLLLSAYRDAGGDPGDATLVAGFAVHRAQVRAKIAFLRAAQLGGAAAERRRSSALHLLDVADRLAWSARGPMLLVVSGPPASGKSTLASALARAGDLTVLSSDALRRSELTVPADERAPEEAYTPAARRRIYAELGAQASAALRAGTVVVDATFGDPAHRDAFVQELSPADRDRLRLIVCEAPLDVRVERARRRAAARVDPSDAGPEVVRRLTGPIAEPPSAQRLEVETSGPVDDLVARVARWIDESP